MSGHVGTPGGRRYHRRACSIITSWPGHLSVIRWEDTAQAVYDRRTPCPVCNPPVIFTESNPLFDQPPGESINPKKETP